MAATPDRPRLLARRRPTAASSPSATPTFHGSTGAIHLNQPIVGMAATPTGNGYWLVASDGGIFAFGDAAFYGSTGTMHLNQPIVGMAADADRQAATGSSPPTAASSPSATPFHGSTGAIHLNQPIVGMAADADGKGYWLVASDGGIFSFGDALPRLHRRIQLNQPIVGVTGS